MNKIAIVFWSGTGNTKAMADHIAQGVRAAGGEAELLGPGEFSADRLTAYSTVSFGCPAMGCEVLEEMEFEPMFAALEGSLSGRRIALFGSNVWERLVDRPITAIPPASCPVLCRPPRRLRPAPR